MASLTEKRVEVKDTLWFVRFCGGCPLLKTRKSGPPICTKLNRIVADTERIMPECPLDDR